MSIDARKLRTAALLLHFDVSWVSRILDGDALQLNPEERALFASIDRRAFRADPERKARAAAAVVDELPVATAVAGLPQLFSFFSSPAFIDVIEQRTSLVEGVALFLGPPAAVEGCIARARRRRRHGGPFTLAPGIDGAGALARGTIERWTKLRTSLGPQPAEAVMRGARLRWEPMDPGEQEGVVVDGGLGDPRVASCTHDLGLLLAAARHQGHDALVALARGRGCDEDEAAALLGDLQREGLLVDVV